MTAMVTRVRELSTTSKIVIAVLLALLILLVAASLAITTGRTEGGHSTQTPVQPNPYAGP